MHYYSHQIGLPTRRAAYPPGINPINSNFSVSEPHGGSVYQEPGFYSGKRHMPLHTSGSYSKEKPKIEPMARKKSFKEACGIGSGLFFLMLVGALLIAELAVSYWAQYHTSLPGSTKLFQPIAAHANATKALLASHLPSFTSLRSHLPHLNVTAWHETITGLVAFLGPIVGANSPILESPPAPQEDEEAALLPLPEEVHLGEVLTEPLGSGKLGFKLAGSGMEGVLVHEAYHWPINATRAPPCGVPLACPHISKCSAQSSYVAGLCSNPGLEDVRKVQGSFPLNHLGEERYQAQAMAPFTGNTYVFDNVYLDGKGRVFNKTHFFIMGGCASTAEKLYFANTTKLTKFKVLANLVTWSGHKFFHTVTETVPDLLILEEIIRKYPTIPIAIKKSQVNGPLNSLASWLGLPLANLNLHFLKDHGNKNPVKVDNLFFAEKLLVPSHQFCGKPSAAVVQRMRERFRVGDIRSRQVQSPLWERAAKLQRWVIVIGQRPPGSPRSLIGHDRLQARIEGVYGKGRVRSFSGNMTVAETMDLLGRAILFVGVHGGGLANAIFMPSGSAMVEIMPDSLNNACFHFLADRCELDYYQYSARGNFSTPTKANMSSILHLIKIVLPQNKVMLVSK